MEHLSAGDLTIESKMVPPQPILCVWRGMSNHRHPEQIIMPYLTQVLEAAASNKVSIEMHFEPLEHFNSSTISVLIELIQAARDCDVRLTLYYDEDLKWQKLSFDALRVLAKNDSMFECIPLRGTRS